MNKIKVGIVGHRGNIGGSLVEILSRHPFAEIVCADIRIKGKFDDLAETEFVFLALPDGESRNYLPLLNGKMVIDHSLDHRNLWTYGLPEIFRDDVRGMRKIAMPGCWATSIILGLYPLRGIIKSVKVSGVSGISGTRKKEVSKEDNVRGYKTGKVHEQIPEIERAIDFGDLIFVPAVTENTFRGLVSTIFVQTDSCFGNVALSYAEAYAGSPFVRIIKEMDDIQTRNVIRTNYCDIKVMQFGKDIVIISALDNLGKGGAGQAVQNFNLMCGFPETTGLI